MESAPDPQQLQAKVAELEEQVQRWRQAAVKTWSKSVAVHHNEATAADAAARELAELKAKVKDLQTANGTLRTQVRELRRQQYGRRAVRAALRRLR